MSISVMPSERDLRTLAGIVSDHRADLPKDGLPLSLLAELMGQIRCEHRRIPRLRQRAAANVVLAAPPGR